MEFSSNDPREAEVTRRALAISEACQALGFVPPARPLSHSEPPTEAPDMDKEEALRRAEVQRRQRLNDAKRFMFRVWATRRGLDLDRLIHERRCVLRGVYTDHVASEVA